MFDSNMDSYIVGWLIADYDITNNNAIRWSHGYGYILKQWFAYYVNILNVKVILIKNFNWNSNLTINFVWKFQLKILNNGCFN